MRVIYLVILLFTLSLSACKEKQKSASEKKEKQEQKRGPQPDGEATYFSISNFFVDQWNTRRGDPYTLLRIIRSNGKTDSAFVPLDSALWFSLRAKFDAGDISDPDFLGKYNFEMFDDRTTEMTHLHYEAKSPELFMQKMDIGADMMTNLVKMVYMETRESKNGYLRTQKLQYIPDRIFQIQEFEKFSGTPEKNLRIEYLFNY